MCGLAGFLRTPQTPGREMHRQWLEAMGQSLIHRGPDAGSIYIDDFIGLSHRRLSIIDLSEAGIQPMVSASGRFVIAFNGEIYNFLELRSSLETEGYHFRTHTDTEVFLTLFERDGVDCVHHLNGMFAAAIWDTLKRRIFLVRDRLGKKPIYYYEQNGQFAFASEIKALHCLPFMRTQLKPEAIKDFFFYQYIPDPKTIFRHVHKLPPGHWLVSDGGSVKTEQYWDLSFANTITGDIPDFAEGLRERLDDAVRLRMISDVPLGAFLSGGVDSSAVVELMAHHSSQPVTTCSIGFDSKRFDEVEYARQIANLFHTDHHEFTVRETVSDHLAEIAYYFDEPFADPSFVPTFYVSQLARRKVTVALAGDGGDENFAGYGKYAIDALENRLRRLFPGTLRYHFFPFLSRAISGFGPKPFSRAASLLSNLALDPATGFYGSNCFCKPEVWSRIAQDSLLTSTDTYDPADLTRSYYQKADTDDHLSRILYADFKTYLPGDILVKVDRMSMANSLETRAPILDYRVVEYAASLPSNMKLRGKEKKFILKKAFETTLPNDILYRKKMGFSVPLARWLRHEIRSLGEELLTTDKGGLPEFFKINEIKKLWDIHQQGDDRYTQELWTLLAFALWRRAYPL